MRALPVFRLLLAAAFIFAAAPGTASAAKYASIVVNMDTAEVLHSRQADETRYPASLTKVMTLYLVFDALKSGELKADEAIRVSKAASRQQPSKLGLPAGSHIKVEDAIRALVTKSANDVAVVLAERLAGTEKKFAVLMNAKAQELGLTRTVFRNASGLPNREQVSTARDLAKLAEAIFFDHRDVYAYFSTEEFVWRNRHYENHNRLLRTVEGVDGIKTGFTNASGFNLMASAERDGKRVVAVMLGGSSSQSRDEHVRDLLEAAFATLEGLPPAGEDDVRSLLAFGQPDAALTGSADTLALNELRRFTAPEDTDVTAPDSGSEEGSLSSE